MRCGQTQSKIVGKSCSFDNSGFGLGRKFALHFHGNQSDQIPWCFDGGNDSQWGLCDRSTPGDYNQKLAFLKGPKFAPRIAAEDNPSTCVLPCMVLAIHSCWQLVVHSGRSLKLSLSHVGNIFRFLAGYSGRITVLRSGKTLRIYDINYGVFIAKTWSYKEFG